MPIVDRELTVTHLQITRDAFDEESKFSSSGNL